MFTGIIQSKGRIATIAPNAFGIRLTVDISGWRPIVSPALGDSVCVQGVCLTIGSQTPNQMTFDVIAETLSKTSLGKCQAGRLVNLELSLTPSTPMGGHFVQGHVDGVGQVIQVQSSESEWRIAIRPPVDLMDYIVPKGSIAIDGVSLTLASVQQDRFEVALIPTTLHLTTLGELKAGDPVNLETDIVSKTIVHWLRRQTDSSGRLTLDKLRQAGFLDA